MKRNVPMFMISCLLVASTANAFQIQRTEKPELSAPRGVMGPLRKNYQYKSGESTCFPADDTTHWALFENAFKDELKKAGIYEGATVWSKENRNKYLELQPLVKITIKKIELVIEIYKHVRTGEEGCDDTYAVITADVDGKQRDIKFADYAHEEDRAYAIIESFHTKNPAAKWSKKTIAAVKEGNVILGMTRAQATESWGEPREVNRNVGPWGVKEQWVYGSKSYLYFTNDKLISFQN